MNTLTRFLWWAVLGVLLLITSLASGQTTWHVDDSAPAGGDGETWSTAFRDLQDALAIADEGDEILVGQGTYKPGTSESDTFLIRARAARVRQMTARTAISVPTASAATR